MEHFSHALASTLEGCFNCKFFLRIKRTKPPVYTYTPLKKKCKARNMQDIPGSVMTMVDPDELARRYQGMRLYPVWCPRFK